MYNFLMARPGRQLGRYPPYRSMAHSNFRPRLFRVTVHTHKRANSGRGNVPLLTYGDRVGLWRPLIEVPRANLVAQVRFSVCPS